MSILDGIPTKEDMEAAGKHFGPVIDAFMKSDKLTDRDRSFFELMNEGISPATILGLKKQHLDALLSAGIGQIQSGNLAEAKETLMQLHMLAPTDERAVYALGCACQAEGDLGAAAKLFVQFLASDATNPDGHLRLAECLMAAGELEDAEASFDIARGLAAKGHGPADRVAYAEEMRDAVRARIAAAA